MSGEGLFSAALQLDSCLQVNTGGSSKGGISCVGCGWMNEAWLRPHFFSSSFSSRAFCSLCLRVVLAGAIGNHEDTENTGQRQSDAASVQTRITGRKRLTS